MADWQQAAAAFTAYMRENPATVYSDSLYSLSGFIDEFSTVCFPLKDGKGKEGKLSKKDMGVLLRWLNRDCGVVVTSGDVRPFLIFISTSSHLIILPISQPCNLNLKVEWKADGRLSKSYQKERG
jgi:hypothetical protein